MKYCLVVAMLLVEAACTPQAAADRGYELELAVPAAGQITFH